MSSNRMSSEMLVLIHLPMSLMQASRILLVSQPVRPAEQGTTGSTCRNLEFVFIITCNLARSSRTSRRTICLSGRERAGLPCVNPVRLKMNPRTMFIIWNLKTQLDSHFRWTGSTYFVDKSIQDPSKALAAAKKVRDKSGAKKAARAQGFTFLDELEQHKSKCTTKNVNTVEYDMRQFLQQCIDRYVELAGPNVKFKKVTTPFPDDKIARPIMDEAEARGELQPIASRVLMKVLFAARMATVGLIFSVPLRD